MINRRKQQHFDELLNSLQPGNRETVPAEHDEEEPRLVKLESPPIGLRMNLLAEYPVNRQ